ncbi:MAG: acyl--CoA ligase [Rhodospirillales bacterium]|nr:acyl--CoA ligase [Rhodospirillales bacterium]
MSATLHRLFEAHARSRAATPFILSRHSALTYGDVSDRVASVQASLRTRGIEPGDHVALCLDRKADFVVGLLAVLGIGAVAVPIDTRDGDGQAWLLRHSEVRLVLHDDALVPGTAERAGVPGQAFLAAPESADANGRTMAAVDCNESTPAAILYTSGTQNQRKGVILSHANLVAPARYMNSFMGVDSSIVEYVSSPLEHAFGFGRLRCVIVAGGGMVFDDGSFNAARLLASMRSVAVNALSGVAASVALLVERALAELAPFSHRLRWMEIGSQSLQRDHKIALAKLFPKACLVQNYGMTEAVRCTMVDFGHDPERLVTCGRASPGTGIRIRGENGEPAPVGQSGVIEVRGPQVALGYWRAQPLWDARLSQGWFESDDVGFLDVDGYLHYVSRRDDLINLGGEKISPLDLENAFRSALEGVEFAVCGIDDPERLRGEVPILCLKRAPEAIADWSELRRRLIGCVANRFLPRAAYLVDPLPRTALGKIQRRKLRHLVEAGQVRLWS